MWGGGTGWGEAGLGGGRPISRRPGGRKGWAEAGCASKDAPQALMESPEGRKGPASLPAGWKVPPEKHVCRGRAR